MPRLDLLALRKQMRVAVFVTHFRSAEINPFGRFRVVGDCGSDFFTGGDRLGESQNQLVAGDLVALEWRRGGHGMDMEINRIQLELLNRLDYRLKSKHR